MAKERTKKPDTVSLRRAIAEGDYKVKLSMILMGFGCMARKQIGKGLLILLFEISFIYFMLADGIYNLSMFPSLGWREQTKVLNDAGFYEYQAGDNSVIILLYGVATLFVIAAFIALWVVQLKLAYKLQVREETSRHINSLKEDIISLFNQNLHMTLMTLPCLGILFFNIVPLVFMISMAFTNYSKEKDHLILFDWNGLTNFGRVLIERIRISRGSGDSVLYYPLRFHSSYLC